MAIVKIGIIKGGNTKEYIATGNTVTDLAELNSHYLNVGIGSVCMMKQTKEVAFFDGTIWFIW